MVALMFVLVAISFPYLSKLKNRDLEESNVLTKSNITLRQYLLHSDGFHLSMAPAFFGFYGYFGALIVLEEEVGIVPSASNIHLNMSSSTRLISVCGASSGAMSAVLLSAGIKPQVAAEFACSLDFNSFADPLGWFALLKGNRFESIMKEFLECHNSMNQHQCKTRNLKSWLSC